MLCNCTLILWIPFAIPNFWLEQNKKENTIYNIYIDFFLLLIKHEFFFLNTYLSIYFLKRITLSISILLCNPFFCFENNLYHKNLVREPIIIFNINRKLKTVILFQTVIYHTFYKNFYLIIQNWYNLFILDSV